MRDRLLSELLRPTEVAELLLPSNEIQALEAMQTGSWPMNLLFFGPPGAGKTSAARILGRSDAPDYCEIAGAALKDAASVSSVEKFAVAMSFSGGSRVCVIDEADSMSKAADRVLRPLMERVSDNCRFILTANEIDRLSEQMCSRTQAIFFRPLASEKDRAFARWAPRFLPKLRGVGIDIDEQQLRTMLDDCGWDLRALANRLEFSRFAGGAKGSRES
jgi:DNA polymerase III delta prime subunit